jgi:AMP-binding enzyme C-terminal domain
VLTGYPGVRDAVCFGVPDEKYGELVAAAVTLDRDTGPSALTEPRVLIDYCREHLAQFKVPVRIDILDEIPRTPTGKVQRRRVADLVTGHSPSQPPSAPTSRSASGSASTSRSASGPAPASHPASGGAPTSHAASGPASTSHPASGTGGEQGADS